MYNGSMALAITGMTMAAYDLVPGAAEAHGEHIEIGHRSRRSSAVRFKYGILNHGEIAVDIQLGLDEGDRRIHHASSGQSTEPIIRTE